MAPSTMTGPGPDLPPLREVIARHRLSAAKSLGQHFLLDLNLTGRIARSAGGLDAGTTIEIGPGPGGLTRALLGEGAGLVVAVEKDRRCREALNDLAAAYPERLRLVEGDALELDLRTFGPAPRRIVANLPYNIATALLVAWMGHLAEDSGAYESLTLMFQREVAERLVAKPGSKTYGRLSVLTQWLTEASILFDVPARAFTPPPKVTSSVIRLQPRPRPLAPARLGTLERVTAAAFGQRRKMLRSALKGFAPDIEARLRECDIAPTARAEEISIERYARLARALSGRDDFNG